MEEIPIAYPILDQSDQISIINIKYDVDYDFVIKYKVNDFVEITLKRSYIVYQQLITKSDLVLDRLYKLIINSLNKEPHYLIDIKLDNDIILDIQFNSDVIDINQQITLIRQSDTKSTYLLINKVNKFNNKNFISYLVYLLIIIIILLVDKVKKLENKQQINNNEIKDLEYKLYSCNNDYIHINKLTNKVNKLENKLYICNNKLINKVDEIKELEDKLYNCNNTNDNRLEDKLYNYNNTNDNRLEDKHYKCNNTTHIDDNKLYKKTSFFNDIFHMYLQKRKY